MDAFPHLYPLTVSLFGLFDAPPQVGSSSAVPRTVPQSSDQSLYFTLYPKFSFRKNPGGCGHFYIIYPALNVEHSTYWCGPRFSLCCMSSLFSLWPRFPVVSSLNLSNKAEKAPPPPKKTKPCLWNSGSRDFKHASGALSAVY